MNRLSTRLLMSCAAIGVAGGVLFTVHALVGGLVVNIVPFVYGLTMGVYFFPGALAQALFRRPGVGLITSAIAGLVAVPFQPITYMALVIGIGIGIAQEVPFAVTRYRNWKPWLFAVAGVVQGLVVTGAAFGVLKNHDLSVAGAVLVAVCFFVSPPVFTWFALRLARALDRAGVARGLRADETERRDGSE